MNNVTRKLHSIYLNIYNDKRKLAKTKTILISTKLLKEIFNNMTSVMMKRTTLNSKQKITKIFDLSVIEIDNESLSYYKIA